MRTTRNWTRRPTRHGDQKCGSNSYCACVWFSFYLKPISWVVTTHQLAIKPHIKGIKSVKLIIATLALSCVVYESVDSRIVFKQVCDSFRVSCWWTINEDDLSDSVLDIQRVVFKEFWILSGLCSREEQDHNEQVRCYVWTVPYVYH